MHTSPNELDADIIIIGGGISGLSAAYYILQCEPSLDVLVLEAKRGRTLTLPLKTSPTGGLRCFDLGAQFITTSQPFINSLVKNLKLEVISSNTEKDEGKIIFDLEPKLPAYLPISLSDFTKTVEWLEIVNFFKKINIMCLKVTFQEPHTFEQSLKLDYTSMEEFIMSNLEHPLSQNFIRHVLRNSCGLEASQISVLFYLAYCNATGGMQNQVFLNTKNLTWIKGGADQICDKIALLIGKEYIKTNSPVIEISWDSSQVIIGTDSEIYSAKYAILAIPPASIMKINFDPCIKEHRLNVLKNLNLGNLIKFTVTYETAFWRRMGYNGTIISCGKIDSDSYVQWCVDVTHNNSAALCGYFVSKNSNSKTKLYNKDEVLEDLARYFGSDALHPVDYFEKNFVGDTNPYVMCVPKLGDMNDFSVLRRPLGNLFFGGTEMSTCWSGHMEGAVQAGYRAASEVLYQFRPQNIIFRKIQEITKPYDKFTT
ncbi:hypothetical protein RN001_013436 [Aquatica leii]|uniref:Amine oxidase n=1 Tax=Aquatica leii TaxID=1421715 RepID=A0AAN7P2G1_9COLE|nr:hypothetical protein RN001_013436 [Aquatica leii]